ncbi:hypothetical protein BABINDRAFT_162246 [Babjeviella inositovora NRRL Y-12698]|uniref:Uncharacterized protein n=1 Tax=Babjeviella inositovora NRRL Y-12698 TaxID=984486 RepID=A0A1E3QQG9_9ASCO|nr:uncharacterized protein BABINDRAFT_162246 [Babjeviella inositovora NRRL Y-12698]ODQ79207.1 hypothetical protein BABINDRAFT_162246 [Babjeviella inositovora NRRL Y-12698]
MTSPRGSSSHLVFSPTFQNTLLTVPSLSISPPRSVPSGHKRSSSSSHSVPRLGNSDLEHCLLPKLSASHMADAYRFGSSPISTSSRRYSSDYEAGPYPVYVHPGRIQSPPYSHSASSAKPLAPPDLPFTHHQYTLSSPTSIRSSDPHLRSSSIRRLSNEEIIDAMEKEQDAIVLRLTREIMQLKEENKMLRQQQHNHLPSFCQSLQHTFQSRSRSSSVMSNVGNNIALSARNSVAGDAFGPLSVSTNTTAPGLVSSSSASAKLRRGSNLGINSSGEAGFHQSLLSEI